jgi:thioredoxin 1
MPARPITDATWDTEVLEHDGTVVVSFCTEHSSPCRMFRPVIDALAGAGSGAFQVRSLDVDANPAIARRYGVTTTPTVLVFRRGALSQRLVGTRCEARLSAELATPGGVASTSPTDAP